MSARSRDSAASGRLLVVATPIGNLGDITLRALEALRIADVIAAEDTRVTRKLLVRYEIDTPLERFDEHVAERRAPELVSRIAAGETIALVSDAGTPGVSDPGARLIALAAESGLTIEAIPGASALLAATVASGLPMQRIYFAGFLPRKAGERRKLLGEIASLDATLVFFESPKRAAATLDALAEAYPGRAAALARELTKLHEEVLRAPIEQLASEVAERGELKGEVVLLVGPPVVGPVGVEPDDDALRSRLGELESTGMRRSEAVKQVAAETGASRKRVYEVAHTPTERSKPSAT